jgi:polysaccharide deacetylase family protein (PEP-CTERM system associated)
MTKHLPAASKQHILTIALEDYFQVATFKRVIQGRRWYRFEHRIEENTLKTLALLDQFHIRATFFVLGWVADAMPEIVREVAKRGHEIAAKRYHDKALPEMSPEEFREDLSRSREAIERASQTKVLGHRHQWLKSSDLWALEILAEEGYSYDSSVRPMFRSFGADTRFRFAQPHLWRNGQIWEFPVSAFNFLGCQVPVSGGNYFRQLPHPLIKRAIEYWDSTVDFPFVMYFHVWELDPDQPRIEAASSLARIRQYRNLDKTSGILESYFRRYRFGGIADYLGLNKAGENSQLKGRNSTSVDRCEGKLGNSDLRLKAQCLDSLGAIARIPVTVVIPCFNEEANLPYLRNTLRNAQSSFNEHKLHFIFVDDASVDGTWKTLQSLFGSSSDCSLLRHEENMGVARAILSGIRAAKTDIVCSMDCDCTYDPNELRNMIPLLTAGTDLVTASPYHPQGKVSNVPAWRLTLSKASSFLYRRVLKQKLSTYTSCFRVYRKTAIEGVVIREGGFLGVTEMLGKLDLQGSKIVEYPTTLEVRMFGQSKMKVLRTIGGHISLLFRLLTMRVLGGDRSGKMTLKRDPVSPPGFVSCLQSDISERTSDHE